MQRFKDKFALITGGTSGIGFAQSSRGGVPGLSLLCHTFQKIGRTCRNCQCGIISCFPGSLLHTWNGIKGGCRCFNYQIIRLLTILY